MKIIIAIMLILLVSSNVNAQSAIPAEKVMQDALQKAKRESKNVFVVFSASWCGPCKYLKRGLYDVYNVQYFESNFVLVELIIYETPKNKHLENHGSDSVLKHYDGDTTGIPYWMILSGSGKKLHGELGFTNHPDYLKKFIGTLKKYSKLRDVELTMIYDRFIQISKLDRLYD